MIKIYFLEIKNAQKYSKEFAINIISKELNINKEQLYLSTDTYGKPYLSNIDNFHFNISHSNSMIVCGISEIQIGVDIEKIKNINKKIVERFFAQNETEYIYEKNSEQNKKFIEIWTKKEAYIKWIGKGIEIPFKSFNVINDLRIKTIHIGEYILSVCSNNILNGVDIDLIEVNNI